ncbi:MAG: tail fiber domain-containing protein [Bacteroidota bacterium]
MSDARMKEDIRDFNYGLEELMRLKTISYQYNGKGGSRKGDKKVGLLAQDLQKLVPELVTEITRQEIQAVSLVDKNASTKEVTYLGIKDNELKYLLINAIKDQQAIITAYEAQIKQLEAKLDKLTTSTSSNN